MKCQRPSLLTCFGKNKAEKSHSSSVRKYGISETPKRGCVDVIKTNLLLVQSEKLSPKEGGGLPQVTQRIRLRRPLRSHPNFINVQITSSCYPTPGMCLPSLCSPNPQPSPSLG